MRPDTRTSRLGRSLSWVLVALALVGSLAPTSVARDPGVRGGGPAAGGPIGRLSAEEQALFLAGLRQFLEVQSVQGTIEGTERGLGPRFNLDSCAGCHAQPSVGGSSPSVNPQIDTASRAGGRNAAPLFVRRDGPVMEARFKRHRDGSRDGGVHALFTIAGRADAPGCDLAQPDFDTEAVRDNISLRIPTPVFGAGLIEGVPDSVIRANMNANRGDKRALGIEGHPNRSGNDGTITRFGWKAQNKSLELFSAEAYNVEQGVTTDLFPTERDETPSCLFNQTPENQSELDAESAVEAQADVVKFAAFMRFLAPPAPAPDTRATRRGRTLFEKIGCALCHSPSLATGAAASPALSGQQVPLYSDLLVHRMGPGLADDVIQGGAGPDEFRTAPLWGLGQRIFFLHDGRTADLRHAIRLHESGGDGHTPGSEANKVIRHFEGLSESQKQDLLDFLRSL